ncbi:hypothetical protein BFJ72_g15359, partial [Fusarium proliferatum]
MADLKRELAEARALRFTPKVVPDLPAPAPASSGKTSGWDFSAYGKNVHRAWSESYAHGHGTARGQKLSASQGSRPLYSTKLLAFRAMRNALEQRFAGELAQAHHRHHGCPVGALWRQGVHDDAGRLVGVAVVGRPVARALDDGLTVEVTRLCTDGAANACSLLYAATKRAAEAKGYRRGLTYILSSESGTSLRASNWTLLWTVHGRSWDCPSRPRIDKHPTTDKQAWGWGSWP